MLGTVTDAGFAERYELGIHDNVSICALRRRRD